MAGATPYIKFGPKNICTPSHLPIWQRLFRKFWCERDEWLKHYHRRSNVETTFSMIKRKFGGSSTGTTFATKPICEPNRRQDRWMSCFRTAGLASATEAPPNLECASEYVEADSDSGARTQPGEATI